MPFGCECNSRDLFCDGCLKHFCEKHGREHEEAMSEITARSMFSSQSRRGEASADCKANPKQAAKRDLEAAYRAISRAGSIFSKQRSYDRRAQNHTEYRQCRSEEITWIPRWSRLPSQVSKLIVGICELVGPKPVLNIVFAEGLEHINRPIWLWLDNLEVSFPIHLNGSYPSQQRTITFTPLRTNIALVPFVRRRFSRRNLYACSE